MKECVLCETPHCVWLRSSVQLNCVTHPLIMYRRSFTAKRVCRSKLYHLRACPNVSKRRWCGSCKDYHDNYEEGEGWAYAPFGQLTPYSLVTYYCFLDGTVYDITSAAHALGLRSKALGGKHFKITLESSKGGGAFRSQGRRGGSFDAGSGKAGQGHSSSRRRGKAGFGKKKRGR
jgi:Cleavage inducing molecular chaperone